MMSPELQRILAELEELVAQIKALSSQAPPTAGSTTHQEPPSSLDLAAFFASVRTSLFHGKLTSGQVQGMEAKIQSGVEAKFPLSWMAYALATSYHETAQRMLPVREGLSASETWRKKNLRYYPYYGRGDVQLTWKENYERADRELNLGGALVKNLDLALDPDISAKIMIRGMKEGWFSKGNTLAKHLPDEEATVAQFTPARRIINIMDKAAMIAGYAVKFQTGLKEAGYGNTDPK